MSKIKEAIELLGMFDLECSACGIIDHLTAELKECQEGATMNNRIEMERKCHGSQNRKQT